MSERDDPLLRKTVSVPQSLWLAVREYRFKSRIDSESDTVRRLLVAGLAAEGFPTSVAPDSDEPSRQ